MNTALIKIGSHEFDPTKVTSFSFDGEKLSITRVTAGLIDSDGMSASATETLTFTGENAVRAFKEVLAVKQQYRTPEHPPQ